MGERTSAVTKVAEFVLPRLTGWRSKDFFFLKATGKVQHRQADRERRTPKTFPAAKMPTFLVGLVSVLINDIVEPARVEVPAFLSSHLNAATSDWLLALHRNHTAAPPKCHRIVTNVL